MEPKSGGVKINYKIITWIQLIICYHLILHWIICCDRKWKWILTDSTSMITSKDATASINMFVIDLYMATLLYLFISQLKEFIDKKTIAKLSIWFALKVNNIVVYWAAIALCSVLYFPFVNMLVYSDGPVEHKGLIIVWITKA